MLAASERPLVVVIEEAEAVDTLTLQDLILVLSEVHLFDSIHSNYMQGGGLRVGTLSIVHLAFQPCHISNIMSEQKLAALVQQTIQCNKLLP